MRKNSFKSRPVSRSKNYVLSRQYFYTLAKTDKFANLLADQRITNRDFHLLTDLYHSVIALDARGDVVPSCIHDHRVSLHNRFIPTLF